MVWDTWQQLKEKNKAHDGQAAQTPCRLNVSLNMQRVLLGGIKKTAADALCFRTPKESGLWEVFDAAGSGNYPVPPKALHLSELLSVILNL